MRKVRVAGVPEPYNLPWHLAMEKERFAEVDVAMEWHTVPEGTGRMCQMLRDGELDMAVLVTEGAVRDILNGGEHRVVSSFVESPLPWGVHVPAGSDLWEPAQLVDIPYAISRMGSGSHIMAVLHAERLGRHLGPADLEVVHSMEGAAQRMADGPPVIFLWESYVTSRYVDAGVMRRVDEVRGDWPGFTIVARHAFAMDHPALLQRILAVLDVEVRTLDQSSHTVELVMQNADFHEALAQEWLRNVRWRVGIPATDFAQSLVRTLKELGLVPADAALDLVHGTTGSRG